jgi:hypothetical protein
LIYFMDRTGICKLLSGLCLFMVFGMVPATTTPQGSGEKLVTNYQILERISTKAIKELTSNMPALPREKLICLHLERSNFDGDFVFTNKLVSIFHELDMRVTTEESKQGDYENDTAGYRFSYQLIKMSLWYPEISRKYWIGVKQVEREAEIAVFAQLVDLKTGDIVWVGDTQKEYGDVIPYSVLDRVENINYEFTQPDRHEVRWGRLVEPVVVGGIVTGLIYLFFSNQSED